MNSLYYSMLIFITYGTQTNKSKLSTILIPKTNWNNFYKGANGKVVETTQCESESGRNDARANGKVGETTRIPCR